MYFIDEYATPEVYDAEYGEYDEDLNIFTNIIKEGQVLDLACGTGRMTIALAKKGLFCTGLDKNSKMLKFAKKKSKNFKILYVRGDMRNFHLNKKFDLITMTGNSFQVLLSKHDQENCFMSVYHHLNTNGLFIFNTRNITEDEMRTINTWEFWHEFIDLKGKRVKVYGMQELNENDSTVSYITRRVWDSYENISKITLRFTSFQVLKSLLIKNNLKITKVYGDYKKSAFHNEISKDMIIICKMVI